MTWKEGSRGAGEKSCPLPSQTGRTLTLKENPPEAPELSSSNLPAILPLQVHLVHAVCRPLRSASGLWRMAVPGDQAGIGESQQPCSQKTMLAGAGVPPPILAALSPPSAQQLQAWHLHEYGKEQNGILPTRVTLKGRKAALTNHSCPQERKRPAMSRDSCHPEAYCDSLSLFPADGVY